MFVRVRVCMSASVYVDLVGPSVHCHGKVSVTVNFL